MSMRELGDTLDVLDYKTLERYYGLDDDQVSEVYRVYEEFAGRGRVALVMEIARLRAIERQHDDDVVEAWANG